MADRAYNADGSLVSRRLPGAVIHDPDAMVARALRMVLEGTVEAIDGTVIELDCQTVLIHGDSPEGLVVAQRIRDELLAHRVELAPIQTVLGAQAG